MPKLILVLCFILSTYAHSESCSDLKETATFEVCVFDILQEIKKVNASIQQSPIKIQSSAAQGHRLNPNDELLEEYKFNFFESVDYITLSLREEDEEGFESREKLYSLLTEILEALNKLKESESGFLNRSSMRLYKYTDGIFGQAQPEDLVQSRRNLANAMMNYYRYSQGIFD